MTLRLDNLSPSCDVAHLVRHRLTAVAVTLDNDGLLHMWASTGACLKSLSPAVNSWKWVIRFQCLWIFLKMIPPPHSRLSFRLSMSSKSTAVIGQLEGTIGKLVVLPRAELASQGPSPDGWWTALGKSVTHWAYKLEIPWKQDIWLSYHICSQQTNICKVNKKENLALFPKLLSIIPTELGLLLN